jgi:replicative DNA helicase
MASNNLAQGRNVLYITAEMAEEEISMRIDANLLDVEMSEIEKLSKVTYEKLINRLRSKTAGKLVVKEYPTAAAGAAHFRHLLNELRLKKNFVPDIIYIDYLNICASSRLRAGKVSSYEYVKAIAEELRGLAIEFGVPIVTATQLNRSGYGSSDPDLTDTSESFGLTATADFMFALVQNEQLAEAGQILVKQLKNRYNSPDKMRKFMIGVDRGHMRFYNLEATGFDQAAGLSDDIPLFDKSQKAKSKKDFNDFNFD